MCEGLSRRRGQTTTILEELTSTEPWINERIRVPEVRLVGPKGEQVGIVRLEDALRLAVESDLDLVGVAPQARPPVAKPMDYGKFKYEAAQEARDARRNQSNIIIKEMKLRLKIDNHDYETEEGHVVRLLKAGDKVKIAIMSRGWEQSRPEPDIDLLKQLADDVAEHGLVESAPRQDGRNVLMVFGPIRKKTEARTEQAEERDRCMEQYRANTEMEKAEEARFRAVARPSKKKRGSADNMDPGIDLWRGPVTDRKRANHAEDEIAFGN